MPPSQASVIGNQRGGGGGGGGGRGGGGGVGGLGTSSSGPRGRRRPDGGESLFSISRKGYRCCIHHHCIGERDGCYHCTD